MTQTQGQESKVDHFNEKGNMQTLGQMNSSQGGEPSRQMRSADPNTSLKVPCNGLMTGSHLDQLINPNLPVDSYSILILQLKNFKNVYFF